MRTLAALKSNCESGVNADAGTNSSGVIDVNTTSQSVFAGVAARLQFGCVARCPFVGKNRFDMVSVGGVVTGRRLKFHFAGTFLVGQVALDGQSSKP